MAVKYLLPCGCGENVQVDISQAGSTIPCVCGRELEVPTMRGLRELAQVETDTTPKGDWSPTQGASFSLGLLLLLIGIGITGYAYRHYRVTTPLMGVDEHALYADELEKLTPSELFEDWQEIRREGLADRGQNLFVINRKYNKLMRMRMAIGLCVAVAGLLAIVVPLVGGKRK